MNTQQIIQNRIRMFDDPHTFWGQHRGELIELEKISDYPRGAYYQDDTGMAYLSVHVLKRKWLNRLRQDLLKMYRRDIDMGTLQRRYWARQNALRMQRWIERNTQKNVGA